MDKTILITGASSGLGYYFVNYFTKLGYQVIPLARDASRLEELEKEDGIPFSVCFDLSKLTEFDKVFERIKSESIILNACIHCAGINQGMPIRMNDETLMQQVMTVNAMSFLELGKYLSYKKYMAEGGSIVAISSIASMKNSSGMSVYSASKAALNSIVQTMSKEMVKRKVRVNAILPGYLEEMMKDEVLPFAFQNQEEVKDMITDIQPYGRIPYEQIAYLVEFLLSNKSKYITGSLLEIGGGQ